MVVGECVIEDVSSFVLLIGLALGCGNVVKCAMLLKQPSDLEVRIIGSCLMRGSVYRSFLFLTFT